MRNCNYIKYLVVLIFCVSFVCLQAMAQEFPQAVNFSATIHDANDEAVANTAVNLRVTFYDADNDDEPIFCAIYQTETDSDGNVLLRLDRDMIAYGCNDAPSIGFDEISWGDGAYWMHLEYQSDMAEDFVDLGYIELSSGFYSLVSNYAFVAEKIEGFGLDVSDANGGDVLVYDGATGKWKPVHFEMEGESSEQGNVFTDVREYVDLGLPSGNKWATCNIGAGAPEERGNYYAWGETSNKTNYDLSTYVYCEEANYHNLTKYSTDPEYGYNGFVDSLTWLEPSDDAATINWGANWRTPSVADYYELMVCCTFSDDTVNGVYVKRFTGSNGNSIFLPIAGNYYGSDLDLFPNDDWSEYWTSNLDYSYPPFAWVFQWYPNYCQISNSRWREYGYPVRAIYDPTHGVRPIHNGVPGETLVDNRDGNEYATVTIGNQTWMAENLRYEGDIPLGSSNSTTIAYRYYPVGDENNVRRYGYLYNRVAAMNGESASNLVPSGVRGICPEGWHLPSNFEWAILQNALGGSNVGSRLASASDIWRGVVTQVPEFGTSGFEAMPAGFFNNGYSTLEKYADFWSATERYVNDDIRGGKWSILYNNINLEMGYYKNDMGLSIRCVRDN